MELHSVLKPATVDADGGVHGPQLPRSVVECRSPNGPRPTDCGLPLDARSPACSTVPRQHAVRPFLSTLESSVVLVQVADGLGDSEIDRARSPSVVRTAEAA